MTTATLPYIPVTGRDYVDLTSWAGDATFPTTPVSGSQIEYPDALTVGADGAMSGANNYYLVRHVTASGVVEAITYTIDIADVTAPVLSSPTASATGETTASGSVSTDEANGTLFYLTSANAIEAEADIISLGESQAVSETGVQSVSITGLTEGTPYYTHFVHQDAAGNNSNVATSAQFTTNAAAGPANGTASIPYVPATGMQFVTLAPGFTSNIFAAWDDPAATAGGQLLFYTADGAFDTNGDWTDATELGEVHPFWYIHTNGVVYGCQLDSENLTAYQVSPDAPQGTITFGTPDIDGDSISQPFSYDAADATGFESRIDGGTAQAETSPVDVFSLAYEQSVLIEVRAVNATGAGPWFSVTRTTDAEVVVLPDGIGPGRDNVIAPGSTFVITSTITSVAAGESLLAYITIAGTRYYLTITGWNAGDITVTAPGNLPVSASPELTVQKISLIAA